MKTSPPETPLTVLEIIESAKLLVDQAQLKPEEIRRLASNDPAALTDLLIAYLQLTAPLTKFLDLSLPYLEQELRATPFETQIKETIRQTADIQARTNRIYSAGTELLARKHQLLEESARQKDLEAEINSLTALEQTLQPQALKDMEKQVRDLTERTRNLTPQKIQLETEHRKITDMNQALTQVIADLKAEGQVEADKMFNLTEQLDQILDNHWIQADQRLFEALKRLKQKLKTYHEITRRLEVCTDQLKEVEEAEQHNREIFYRHFKANAEFAEEIFNQPMVTASEDSPLPDPNELKALTEKILQDIQQHDVGLARWIKTRSNIVSQIRKLNKTE